MNAINTRNPQDMIDAECEHIADNRRRHGVSGADYLALALSGGGIRSASFGLGVMQALVSAGKVRAASGGRKCLRQRKHLAVEYCHFLSC